MSIGSNPFQGGGGGSTVADATETTAGKIRIATSEEATAGTNDLIAMTPLTVKERIDASLVGGVEFKGTFNATAGTPSLLNAEQGDLYVIDVAGTIYGQDWSIGDHLLINADMGGTITNSKINKVDNTDTPASETVAGVIEIATDVEAGAGAETNKALVPSNVSSLSIASSQVTGLATVATTGAYADVVGTPTLGTAAAQDVGEDANDVVQLDASARLPAVDGSQLTNLPGLSEDTSPALGGNLTTGTFNISGHLRPDGIRDLGSTDAEWRSLYLGDNGKIIWGDDQDVELIHDPDDGLILDLTGTDGSNDPQFRLTSQTDGSSSPRLSFHSESPSPASGDRVGQVLFEGKDSAANAQVYGLIRGQITDPTSTAESGKISILAYPGYINSKGLHVEGIANEAGGAKVNIDHNGSTYGLALNGTLVTSTAAELNILDGATVNTTELNLLDGGASVGVSITISDTDGFFINDNGVSRLIPASDLKTYAASGASYQPLDAGLTSISGLTTAANKMIFADGSDSYTTTDLTAFARSFLDDADATTARSTLSLGTAATSDSGDFLASTAGLNNLADVSFTAGAGIDNYILTYDNNTTSWGAEAAPAAAVASVTTDSSGTNTTISTHTNQEEIHLIDNGAANVVITIPAASDVSSGYRYQLKRLGTGTVSVAPSSGSIDTAASFSLASQFDSVTLISDGSNYFII